jgi:transcriptional regulator with XRE-family HTH domain
MRENSRGIAPLDWPALVDEAIRRRKAEKMTQKEHAALASVSIPTIVSFDRAETTLSLAKAFDILRVVGLLHEEKGEGAQERFVQEAFLRWRELTAKLPKESPARFPHGFYRIDYALEGELRQPTLVAFEKMLKDAVVPHIGWPLFVDLTRPGLAPYESDGAIECWVKPASEGIERNNDDAAHCDFWRAVPAGRAFAIRGYQEDGQETFAPQTVFDTTLPVWRIGEAFLHAARLTKLLAVKPETVTAHLRVLYTGLTGRILRSWANPLADLLIEGHAARSDEAMLEGSAPAAEIEAHLERFVYPMVASLFERFGVVGLAEDRVKAELDKMRQNRFRGDPLTAR